MAQTKPRIGVIPNRKDRVTEEYLNKLKNVGAEPMVLPITEYREPMARALKRVQGVLLPGGGDFSEDCYENFSSEKRKTLRDVDKLREFAEWLVLDLARQNRKTVFGICRGFQAMNVHAGGTLMADIPLELEGKETPEHRHNKKDKEDKDGDLKLPDHDIFFDPNTELGKLAGFTSHAVFEEGRIRVRVNSSHHQALHKLGSGLRAAAWAADGIIEAIESETYTDLFWFGVQFHPERMEDDFSRKLFELFVKKCTSNM